MRASEHLRDETVRSHEVTHATKAVHAHLMYQDRVYAAVIGVLALDPTRAALVLAAFLEAMGEERARGGRGEVVG